MAVIFALIAVLLLPVLLAFSSTNTIDAKTTSMFCVSGIISMTLFIILRIYSGKLFGLLAMPKKMRSYLIANIIMSIIALIVFLALPLITYSMTSGEVEIFPGLFTLTATGLAIGFSISALNKISVYQEWFEQYNKPIKNERSNKKSASKKTNE